MKLSVDSVPPNVSTLSLSPPANIFTESCPLTNQLIYFHNFQLLSECTREKYQMSRKNS